MASCAELVARTLKGAGVTRMFGLPGGEILDFIDAARKEGIEFILTRQEATAAFMADATGQIQRRPGVCVATLIARGMTNRARARSMVRLSFIGSGGEGARGACRREPATGKIPH